MEVLRRSCSWPLGYFRLRNPVFEFTRQFDHKWGSPNEQNHPKQDFRKSLKSLKLSLFSKNKSKIPFAKLSNCSKKTQKFRKTIFEPLFWQKRVIVPCKITKSFDACHSFTKLTRIFYSENSKMMDLKMRSVGGFSIFLYTNSKKWDVDFGTGASQNQ